MTEVGARTTHLGGRYLLGGELGRGGMSTVYRATDESLGRDVAVKIFSHGLTDAEGLARHREEVKLLASLSHPGLVTLFDAATDEQADRAFLVMELIEGEDLRTRLDRGALPPVEVAVIGRQLAEALAYTHSRGVIHRDVKPGNILLPRRDGEATGAPAKLADFGIARIVDGARLTATGTVMGTAGYFSPEQALGHPLTGGSDIYSLGLVLLEALTGERAFAGSAAESMAARINRDPHIPASLDPQWTELVTLMTRRDPAQRITGPEAAERLGRLAAVPTPAPAPHAEAREPLETTQRYPIAETQPLSSAHSPLQGSAESRGPTTGTAAFTVEQDAGHDATAPMTDARGRRQRRRVPFIAAIVVALTVLAVIVIVMTLQSTASAPPAAPDYPEVSGEIGESLQQLQRTVEP